MLAVADQEGRTPNHNPGQILVTPPATVQGMTG